MSTNEKQALNNWPNADRWKISPWVSYMNKILEKVRSPYDLKKRFDYREDMVSLEQIGNFQLLIAEILENKVPGGFVEFGCYTGSTATLFATLLAANDPAREFHVYDIFDIELGSVKGIRATFEENIRNCGAPMPLIHQGDILQTVPKDVPEQIAFAHLDLGTGGDSALHARLLQHVLQHVYPRMAPHGVMVFMDYHIPGISLGGNAEVNPGVREACDTFFVDKPEKIKLLYGGPCSHAYIRKHE